MTTKIEIRHVCREMMRDNSWSHTDTLVGSFNLTARGLAAATRAMDDDSAYFRRIFGPGTISPSHGTYARIVCADGLTLPVDLSEFLPEPAREYSTFRTWTEAATGLTQYAEENAKIADPADISA